MENYECGLVYIQQINKKYTEKPEIKRHLNSEQNYAK